MCSPVQRGSHTVVQTVGELARQSGLADLRGDRIDVVPDPTHLERTLGEIEDAPRGARIPVPRLIGAGSWFPRIARTWRSRGISSPALGHGLYPTRSPATQMPSGAIRSTSARTACNACRFEWTSARTASRTSRPNELGLYQVLNTK